MSYIVSLSILSLYRLKYENPVYIEVPGNWVIAACGIFFAIFARDSIIEVVMDVLNTIIQILLMICNLICFIYLGLVSARAAANHDFLVNRTGVFNCNDSIIRESLVNAS